MNKLIIYLDQNFISDIAKLSSEDKKDKVNPKLEELFDVIFKGVSEEKFIVPDSWIHKIETPAIKDELLRNQVYQRLKNLGQVSFKAPWEIINTQFTKALLSFLNKKAREYDWWEEAFDKDPNKKINNFDIHVPLPNINWGALSPGTTKAIQDIRDSDVNFNEQYNLEIAAARKIYKEKLKTDYKYTLSHHNIDIKDAERFIDSDDFLKIPNIDIFSNLWSKDLSCETRKGKESDDNDVEMISTYLPYADIMATDNYWYTHIKSSKLDSKYNCHIFSMKEGSLDSMIELLKDKRNKRKAVNQSLFSVMCILSKDKKAYPIEFLKKLNLARNKFQGTGKYWNKGVNVSINLIYNNEDKIEMPKSEIIKKHGHEAFNHDQWSQVLAFGNNFKQIYNKENKNIEQLILEIPEHLRGQATAIISDETKFDIDLREHETDTFYDIEDAINKKLEYTKKYRIKIIY